MARSRPRRPGDLQLRILKILWRRGEATVSEVQEALGRRDRLAYTTVATMLRKMQDRGLVRHRRDRRRFIYRAAIAEDRVTRNLLDDLLDRVFEGSLSELVQNLLSNRDVSADELSRLEALIAEHKRPS